ncbi:MAG: hypothetical protein Q9198_000146 [Flavoplaca austrocitrina]
MDQVHVEAPPSAGQDAISFKSSDARGHHTSDSTITTTGGDDKQFEQINRVAQVVTNRLVHCLQVLVQEELQNSEGPPKTSVPAFPEKSSVVRAKDDAETGARLDTGHRSRRGDEDLDNRSHHMQLSSSPPQARINAPYRKESDGRIEAKDSVGSPEPVLAYTKRVDIMTQEELRIESEHRRSCRGEWRAGRDTSYLEDPWKHLWRKNRDDAESLFRLRLSEICGDAPYPFNDQSSGIKSCTAFRLVQILIECIWVCSSDYPLPTVGDVLVACYKREILPQPRFEQGWHYIRDTEGLRSQYRLVHIVLYLVNILYKHQPPDAFTDDDLEEVWSKPIAVAEQALRHGQGAMMSDVGRQPFLAVSDFNLKDLQEIGKLKIKWTAYWDEHLKIETKRILSETALCGGLEEEDRIQTMEEILLTLNLLLTSNCPTRDLQKRYGQLEAPSWLGLVAHDKLKNTWSPASDIDNTAGTCLSRFWQDDPEMTSFCYEMTDHLLLPWPDHRDLRRVTYDEYPIYYDRLWKLRCYMDAQQPVGLRGLWRDKRNTNAYYTFWIAVGFGVASILLSAFVLAAATVQAYSQVTASQ